MYRFCRAVVAVLGELYLQSPTEKTLPRSWHKLQKYDFLGYSKASIACVGTRRTVHLLGKEYKKGRKGDCSVILEAVTTRSLDWHAFFFGMARFHNDINVL
jgi:hypothetical protein